MPELSTEANVGRIFILIGFIVGFIGSIAMIIMGAAMKSLVPNLTSFFGVFYVILGVVMLVGSVIGVFAFRAASNHEFRNAAILGIVSSIIPPLNIFTLVGGILCLTSREAKERR